MDAPVMPSNGREKHPLLLAEAPALPNVEYAAGPTLVVFDLGGPCERCVAHRGVLREAGFDPVIIAPETPDYERIASEWGCLNLHGTFIVDKAGVVRWGHSFDHPWENIAALNQIMARYV